MRNFNICIISLLLILLSPSCNFKGKKLDNIITVEQGNPAEKDVWSYQFIPLDDSSPDAVFSNISKVIVKNNLTFVLDGQGKKMVYVYDNSGKYIKTVGRIGQGPGEYINARDFNVDKNYIYIYDDRSRQLLTYNYKENTFESSLKTEFSARAFSLLDNGNILFVLPKDQKHNQIVITDNKAKVLRSYVKFREQDKDNRTRYNLLQENDAEKIITYNKPHTDVVYIISKKDGAMLDSYRIKIRGVDNKKVYLSTTPIVFKNSIIGNYVYNNELSFYRIENFNNENKKTAYVDKIKFAHIYLSKLLMPVSLSEDGAACISYINFRILENAVDKEIVKAPVRKHLEDGGYVLCKYKIRGN